MQKITNTRIACLVAILVLTLILLLTAAGDPAGLVAPVLHAGNGALAMYLVLLFAGRLKNPDSTSKML